MVKLLGSLSSDKVVLELFECNCGFHLGLDSTYLEQVDEIVITCPSCGETINTLDEGKK